MSEQEQPLAPAGRPRKGLKGEPVCYCYYPGCGKVYSRAEHLRRHKDKEGHHDQLYVGVSSPSSSSSFANYASSQPTTTFPSYYQDQPNVGISGSTGFATYASPQPTTNSPSSHKAHPPLVGFADSEKPQLPIPDAMITARPEDYKIGWICALPIELVAACALLDEEYGRDRTPKVDTLRDGNTYTFGRIHEHNIVIACITKGQYGTTSAAILAGDMRLSFPSLQFVLSVGIAVGAPSKKHDIRLGDVVVSSPRSWHNGVLQYEFAKAVDKHTFETTGYLAPPPAVLLEALSKLEAQHRRNGHGITETITSMLGNNQRLQKLYSRPDSDALYEESPDGLEQKVVRAERGTREDDPVIHYGLIASSNRLMKDRKARDALITSHDVLCFDLGGGAIMDIFPCVLIRGICGYSDFHKNDQWQGYAAATAAAYAKALLGHISGLRIQLVVERPRAESIADSGHINVVHFSADKQNSIVADSGYVSMERAPWSEQYSTIKEQDQNTKLAMKEKHKYTYSVAPSLATVFQDIRLESLIGNLIEWILESDPDIGDVAEYIDVIQDLLE